ncbi:MAG: eukaryotic-like serine/threonine-protein kinase [Acidobacteriota bacterium]|jgi:serine/threonine protein kinase|nr:eukaryotic-like serine/threonine-protein kinase [Acidobacteriota bacterium]
MNVLNIGRYRVLYLLGGGGSAEVYAAEDTLLHRKVALKLMRFSDADERQSRHFEREARSASLLNHPNAVTVFDVGRDGDVQYIATELVDGETLRQRLNRGPMTIMEAIEVASAVARALAAAHEAWLVHRDIKPENIAIRKDHVVKVLDFGVSALSGDGGDFDATDPIRRPGAVVGTLHYLSPEQVRGELIIDDRSDIYSLGVVTYEMLAGRVPFSGTNVLDVLAQIVERDPAPLPAFVPEPLRDVVMSSLRKNMYERPQTASDIVAMLDQLRIDLLIRERSRIA